MAERARLFHPAAGGPAPWRSTRCSTGSSSAKGRAGTTAGSGSRTCTLTPCSPSTSTASARTCSRWPASPRASAGSRTAASSSSRWRIAGSSAASANGALVTHADLRSFARPSVQRHGGRRGGPRLRRQLRLRLRARREAAHRPALVRVDPDGRAVVAADEMRFPNGSVITPDGAHADRGRVVRRLPHGVRDRPRRRALRPARVGEARGRRARRHLPRRRERGVGRLADVERGAARARGRRGGAAHPGRAPGDRVHARRRATAARCSCSRADGFHAEECVRKRSARVEIDARRRARRRLSLSSRRSP